MPFTIDLPDSGKQRLNDAIDRKVHEISEISSTVGQDEFYARVGVWKSFVGRMIAKVLCKGRMRWENFSGVDEVILCDEGVNRSMGGPIMEAVYLGMRRAVLRRVFAIGDDYSELLRARAFFHGFERIWSLNDSVTDPDLVKSAAKFKTFALTAIDFKEMIVLSEKSRDITPDYSDNFETICESWLQQTETDSAIPPTIHRALHTFVNTTLYQTHANEPSTPLHNPIPLLQHLRLKLREFLRQTPPNSTRESHLQPVLAYLEFWHDTPTHSPLQPLLTDCTASLRIAKFLFGLTLSSIKLLLLLETTNTK